MRGGLLPMMVSPVRVRKSLPRVRLVRASVGYGLATKSASLGSLGVITMRQFQFIVGETRLVDVVYTIEANSQEEAEAKAETGETVAEDFAKDRGVIARTIIEEI